MKLSIILISMLFTVVTYAGSTHTWNAETNTVTTVCDLQGLKLTFEYPNPAGSSNYTNAGSVKLVSSEDDDGMVTTHNLYATQLFLAQFFGPSSYGAAVSGLFVSADAEVVLALNSNTQSVWGKVTQVPYGSDREYRGVCLFETGE